jgi:hypothetical protein
MILVITHNGQPPAKGGLRLGYAFSTAGGGAGVVPASLAALLQTPAASSKPTSSAVRRVKAINQYGDVTCPHCGAKHLDAVPPGLDERHNDCRCGKSFVAHR